MNARPEIQPPSSKVMHIFDSLTDFELTWIQTNKHPSARRIRFYAKLMQHWPFPASNVQWGLLAMAIEEARAIGD